MQACLRRGVLCADKNFFHRHVKPPGKGTGKNFGLIKASLALLNRMHGHGNKSEFTRGRAVPSCKRRIFLNDRNPQLSQPLRHTLFIAKFDFVQHVPNQFVIRERSAIICKMKGFAVTGRTTGGFRFHGNPAPPANRRGHSLEKLLAFRANISPREVERQQSPACDTRRRVYPVQKG